MTSLPSLAHRRSIHPLMAVVLEGPIEESVRQRADGELFDRWDLEKIPAAEAQAYLSLMGDLADPLRDLGWDAVGVYDPSEYRFELRFHSGKKSRYYRLSVDLDASVDRGRLIGRYYGYPDCCNVFTTSWMSLPGYAQSGLDGTGFVPCQACYARPAKDVLSELQARRVCPTPFPEDRFNHDEFLQAQAVLEGQLDVPVRVDVFADQI